MSENNLSRQLGALRYQVENLRRKAEGTTLANARVAKVERQLDRLTRRVDDLGPSASSIQIEVLSQDLATLTATVQGHYRDLQGQIAQLGDEVTTVAGRVDKLESSRAQQIDFDRSTATVSGNNMEVQQDSAWVEGVLAGLVAGGLTALATNWWNASDWPVIKDWWAAIIVGTAVMFIVASFGALRVHTNGLMATLHWATKPTAVATDDRPRWADDVGTQAPLVPDFPEPTWVQAPVVRMAQDNTSS